MLPRHRKREICERILIPKGFSGFQEFYKAQTHLLPDIAMSIQHEIDRYDYGLEVLIGGIKDGIAHIYGIFDPGTSECFDAIGFHAIGSGLPHAINTLIAREHHSGISLEETLSMVYEAKKVAEKAPGVRRDITDICILDADGLAFSPRGKVKDLEKAHQKWFHKEADWKSNIEGLLENRKEWTNATS